MEQGEGDTPTFIIEYEVRTGWFTVRSSAGGEALVAGRFVSGSQWELQGKSLLNEATSQRQLADLLRAYIFAGRSWRTRSESYRVDTGVPVDIVLKSLFWWANPGPGGGMAQWELCQKVAALQCLFEVMVRLLGVEMAVARGELAMSLRQLGLTLEEIGSLMDLTKEHVRRISTQAAVSRLNRETERARKARDHRRFDFGRGVGR